MRLKIADVPTGKFRQRELIFENGLHVSTHEDCIDLYVKAPDGTPINVELDLTEAMTLRNLLSDWGNHKRYRDMRREKSNG